MSARGWPVALQADPVGVRPLRLRDAVRWTEIRLRNEGWLAPWEGRSPSAPDTSWEERHNVAVFSTMLRQLRRDARAGRALPFALTHEGVLVGQITVGNVVRGAFDSAYVGYWLDEQVAGQGVMTTGLALVLRHCFADVGLHRVEANIRPENAASLRVVAKLGFRDEGLHRRYLFIDGDWRDHRTFSLLREDVPGGPVDRLLSQRRAEGDVRHG
jgi:ribosomal-protein-alanine N-acetyltransferase